MGENTKSKKAEGRTVESREPKTEGREPKSEGQEQPTGIHPDSARGEAVKTALLANIGVAMSKMLAAAFTGSSSMLSESIHSLADCSNEVVLLAGRRFSRIKDSRHPFGLYRSKYFAGVVVAILLFALGGLMSLAQSGIRLWDCLFDGQGRSAESGGMLVSLGIVCVSAALETYGLVGSRREAMSRAASMNMDYKGLYRFWRETKSAELASTIMEDTLALVGLVFAGMGTLGSLISGDAVWDAFGGFMVGLVLLVGSALLAYKNVSLLFGEGMSPEQEARLRGIVAAVPGVVRIIELQAIHTSEDTILVCLKIETSKLDRDYVVQTIDKVERAIRAGMPWYTFEIYVEPDVYDARRDRGAVGTKEAPADTEEVPEVEPVSAQPDGFDGLMNLLGEEENVDETPNHWSGVLKGK